MLWVKLIFPELDYLEVMFEFEGKTLIADATELVHALVELQAKIRSTSTPNTPKPGSLTSFFDRMITTHLAHHPEDTQRMMIDPEVIKLKFFERNPDLTDAGLARKARESSIDMRVGPFTPTRVGSDTDEGRTPATCRSMNIAGSARKPFGSEVKATVESFAHTLEDETIEIGTQDLQVQKLPQGGRNEQCIREGMADLQQKGQNIKICIEDYRIYTYWLRETELRNHMEQILRAAISAAKASKDNIKHDKLMKMGNMWKLHPNLASWHDTDEPTEGIHNCFHSKIDEENYHKNGWRAVDFDTRARMTVELYYALKDAKGPEERNFYRQIYQQWHPESYEFRNANFQQYRFYQRREDVDNQYINHEEPERIIIREEEYEEEDVLTVADFNGPEDNETHLWTLTKEQYNAFNMEVKRRARA
jgi:hypothetical protein